MTAPSLRDRLLGFNMDSVLPDVQLGLVGYKTVALYQAARSRHGQRDASGRYLDRVG